MTVLFIKEIDCSVSSRALSSGDSSTNSKENAFNDVYSTFWESSLKGSNVIGNAFIGQYFDVKKRIAKIKYINYTANTAVSSVKVQYSNDLAVWTTIQTFSVSTTANAINTLVITSPSSAQFYRILANSSPLGGDDYGWCVREVELYPSCCETDGGGTCGITMEDQGLPQNVSFKYVDDSSNIIPKLTSYTNGLVTVSASSEYWNNNVNDIVQNAWQAFDKSVNQTGYHEWISDYKTQTLPQWLRIDYGVNTIIAGYWIEMDSNTNRLAKAPKTWQFQGSNDNSTWTTLDTRTNITWTTAERKKFSLSQLSNYRYYRLYVTSSADNLGVTICEFGMFSPIEEAGKSLIPILTGYTGGGVTVSSSSHYWAEEYSGNIEQDQRWVAWKAFDGITTNTFPWLSDPKLQTMPQWLKVDFGSQKQATGYWIHMDSTSYINAPKDWQFQGSNNNSTWTTLDTQADITWSANQKRLFKLSLIPNFRYYRIYITEASNPSWPEQVAISEFGIFNNEIQKIFDDSISTYWQNSAGSLTSWIEYNFSTGKSINGYSLVCFNSTYNYQTKTPKSWLFEGSSDGLTWVTLDTRDNETTWQNLEKRTYFFENSTQYSKYRLRITNNNGYADYTIWEMEMYSVDWTECNIVDEELGSGTVSPPGPPIGSDVTQLDIIYASDFNELKQYVNQRASESGDVDPIETPNVTIGNKITASFMNEIISKHNSLVNRSIQQDLALENVTIGEIITAEKYNNIRSTLHNMTFFSYEFIMTEWSPCSKSCGEGTQTRIVLCRRTDGKIEDDYSPCLAAGLSLPDISVPCTGTSCAACAYIWDAPASAAAYLANHPEAYINVARKYRHENGDCYYSFFYSKTSGVGIGEWKPCPYVCKRWNFGTRPIVIYQLPHGNNISQGAQSFNGTWAAFVTCWTDAINFDPNNIQGIYPSWTIDHGLYQTGYQGVGC